MCQRPRRRSWYRSQTAPPRASTRQYSRSRPSAHQRPSIRQRPITSATSYRRPRQTKAEGIPASRSTRTSTSSSYRLDTAAPGAPAPPRNRTYVREGRMNVRPLGDGSQPLGRRLAAVVPLAVGRAAPGIVEVADQDPVDLDRLSALVEERDPPVRHAPIALDRDRLDVGAQL